MSNPYQPPNEASDIADPAETQEPDAHVSPMQENPVGWTVAGIVVAVVTYQGLMRIVAPAMYYMFRVLGR